MSDVKNVEKEWVRESERDYCDFCGKRRVLYPTRYHDDGSPMDACAECLAGLEEK